MDGQPPSRMADILMKEASRLTMGVCFPSAPLGYRNRICNLLDIVRNHISIIVASD